MSEETQTNAQSSSVSDVEQLFLDYQENKKSKSNKRPTKEEKLAKYFVPRNDVEVFRILPTLPNRKITETAYFHYVMVNTPQGKRGRKIYCLSHNNPKVEKTDANGEVITDESGNPVMVKQRCPLCEKHERILKKQDNSIKYIKKENMTPEQLKINEKNKDIYRDAIKYEARKYYIVRGIDRSKPNDGVKFWRFKDNYRQQGVYDKLIPAMKLYFDQEGVSPTDVLKGADLHITVTDSKLPNGQTYKDVIAITPMKPTPLHPDQIMVDKWMKDTTIWRDVFKESRYGKILESQDYLERIANGTDPYWDDTNPDDKKHIFPNPADAELQKKANTKTESLDSDDSDDEEMASDLERGGADAVISTYQPSISNVTKDDVGEYKDDAVNVTEEVDKKSEPAPEPQVKEKVETPSQTDSDDSNMDDSDYDDLPF